MNFNKKGDEHKTLLGGIFSFMVNIALIIYLAICIRKLITGDENVRLSFLASNDLEEIGDVSYRYDTDIILFAVIRDDGIGGKVPYLDSRSNFS